MYQLEKLAIEDSDVKRENKRIRSTDLTQLFESHNLILKYLTLQIIRNFSTNTKVCKFLRDLTKIYGTDFIAVDKLNLAVESGETFGLLGVNGAGKTTTFKMLTGDIPISAGDAFVYSHSVRTAIANVHRNLGYCPQFDGLIPEMTGRETLRMFARLRGILESEIDETTRRLSESLIFTQHIDKQVQYYRYMTCTLCNLTLNNFQVT